MGHLCDLAINRKCIKPSFEALDYRRMPLVRYRQYVNNPTISAGRPIVKINYEVVVHT